MRDTFVASADTAVEVESDGHRQRLRDRFFAGEPGSLNLSLYSVTSLGQVIARALLPVPATGAGNG
jgi:hypothetical protein